MAPFWEIGIRQLQHGVLGDYKIRSKILELITIIKKAILVIFIMPIIVIVLIIYKTIKGSKK